MANSSEGTLNGSKSAIAPNEASTDKVTHVVLPASFYASFLSQAAKARKPSPIRGLFLLEQTLSFISFFMGRPNAALFSLISIQFTASRVGGIGTESVKLKVDDELLAMGLQYASTSGIPPMVKWLTVFQEPEHWREGARGRVGGSPSLRGCRTRCCGHGGPVLFEEPDACATAVLYGNSSIDDVIKRHHSYIRDVTLRDKVETNDDELISQYLREILDHWPSSKPKPKIVYAIPYGCNPTGATTSLPCGQAVLDISRKHNIVILEGAAYSRLRFPVKTNKQLLFPDDPDYFMYFCTGSHISSYFTLEVQTGDGSVGRVLRFDSFGKTIYPGIRICIGFVTGPAPLLNAMDRHVGGRLTREIPTVNRALPQVSMANMQTSRPSPGLSSPPSCAPGAATSSSRTCAKLWISTALSERMEIPRCQNV
ncbi:hypothetical protein H4582DRAFT_2080297 [Lactarius indigo]|nr:hypothetical protein H4582DRAFT_2080297 [Lactarius indigo]